MKLTEKAEQQVFNRLGKACGVMERSVTEAFSSPQHTAGGLITGVSQVRDEYSNLDSSLCSSRMNHPVVLTFSCSEVSVAMGRICTTPTADTHRTLPTVLLFAQSKRGLTLRRVLCGPLTATELGAIITCNTMVAGTEGGCQTKYDVIVAMASAVTMKFCHGPPEVALHAGSFCLMSVMGLAYDPMAGLIRAPCIQRNASQTMSALLSVDWAFAGQRNVIPPGQVIATMYHTSKMLPVQLHETAQGGPAATPAAKSIFGNVFIKHGETEAF